MLFAVQRFPNFLLPHQFHKVFIAFSWLILHTLSSCEHHRSESQSWPACYHGPLLLPFVHFLISKTSGLSPFENCPGQSLPCFNRSHFGCWTEILQETTDEKTRGHWRTFSVWKWSGNKAGSVCSQQQQEQRISTETLQVHHPPSLWLSPAISDPTAHCHSITGVFSILVTDNFISKQCRHTWPGLTLYDTSLSVWFYWHVWNRPSSSAFVLFCSEVPTFEVMEFTLSLEEGCSRCPEDERAGGENTRGGFSGAVGFSQLC